MALPGLSLPGLGPSQSTATPSGALEGSLQGPPVTTRIEALEARTEWRFEVSLTGSYTIRLLSGTAEIFGSELAPNLLYSFSGVKAAVFTWQGCRLEIAGEAESEYLGSETEYAVEWLNVHGMLEGLRTDAEASLQHGNSGPRVLVVGPENVGKSSLVRSLTAWGVKMGRMPTVVNLDPREGLLTPPSSLVAVTAGSQMEVEGQGYGIAPVSGPTAVATKTPLVYHFPYMSPMEKPEIYKSIITRVATAVTSKLEEDTEAKVSGLIIDTPGAALNDPRSNYDLIAHIVSEFSINIILAIGSERLYSDLNRRFGANAGVAGQTDSATVLRITKPGGAVERDPAFLKGLRQHETRQYFFGTPKETLNPHSQVVSYNDLTIYRAKSSAFASEDDDNAGNGGDDDDDDYEPSAGNNEDSSVVFEKAAPSAAMTGSLVAVKFCPSASDLDTIRDSAVMAFLYVADVDETKKRIRFLAPHPQRWADRALVWGAWPEPTAGLVG